MKNFSKMLVVAGFGLAFSTFASATIVDTSWDVSATFSDGRQGNDIVTGDFVIDSNFNFVSWDITITGPDGNTYKTGSSDTPILEDSNKYIVFEDSQLGPGLALFLNTALPSGPGSPIMLGAGNGSFQANVCSFLCLNGGDTFVSGTLTDSPAVPEPASAALLVPGVLGAALFLLRRRVAAKQ